MPSLMDINQQLNQLAELLNDPNKTEEELLQIFNDIAESQDNEQDKIEGICNYIRNIYYRSQIRMAEVKRIKKLAENDQKTIEQLENFLLFYLQSKGIGVDDFYQTKTSRIKICKSGGRIPIKISPEIEKNFNKYKDVIPDKYKETIIQLNKRQIREDLENGKQLDFAEIGEQSIYLRGIKPDKMDE